jgi:hypothetical protein
MHFLPALLGVPSAEIDGEYCQLLTHSIKLGGLAIRNHVDTAPSVHKASLGATCHLTKSLVDPATSHKYWKYFQFFFDASIIGPYVGISMF